MIFTFALSAALLMEAQRTPLPIECAKSHNLTKLIENRTVDWLVIGEPHGTEEVPFLFSQIVCAAAKHRSVIVALEHPVSTQRDIDTYLSSSGDGEAVSRFLSTPLWNNQLPDGRTSKAMLKLFQWLRVEYGLGKIKKVIAIAPNEFAVGDSYERAMAANMLLGQEQGVLVIALTGNAHARLRSLTTDESSYRPMAAFFPAVRVRTINVVPAGGEQWACLSFYDCKPIKISGDLQKYGTASSKQLKKNSDNKPNYHFNYFLGKPATASKPQVNIKY